MKFHPNVFTIKELKDIVTLKMEKLHGILMTYQNEDREGEDIK